ncbi:MAG: hypothetical protein M3R46_10280, partial [Actinomycetota bacterium]|nr:hypothetical protein [Actinomycetota bacterium]
DLVESPAPAVALWELVGEQQRQAATSLLAALIAQTVAGEAVSARDGGFLPTSDDKNSPPR